MFRRDVMALGVGCGVVASGGASATVLTFDLPGFSDSLMISEDYGDNVTVFDDGMGTTYGSMFGATPDITVTYNQLLQWTNNYGDLRNVIYGQGTGFTITLESSSETDVVGLYGFDLAGWPNTDYTVPGVSVVDLDTDEVLFEATDLLVRGSSTDADGRRHTSIDFESPLTAARLGIVVDTTGLGGANDNIGIDNIAFGQIPGPGVVASLAVGGLLVGGRRRG